MIGNYGLSYEEEKAQMALWSILAAPLIMSNDLCNLPAWSKSILQNKRLIAISQDKLGIQGYYNRTVVSNELSLGNFCALYISCAELVLMQLHVIKSLKQNFCRFPKPYVTNMHLFIMYPHRTVYINAKLRYEFMFECTELLKSYLAIYDLFV